MGPGLDPNSRLLPYRFGMLIDPRGHTNSAVLETRRQLKVERLPEAEPTCRHSLRYNSGRGKMTLTLQPLS
jgi:hypothetical protein